MESEKNVPEEENASMRAEVTEKKLPGSETSTGSEFLSLLRISEFFRFI